MRLALVLIGHLCVVVGAIASGGMMGIAKNTMFSPSLFSVQDLLFIYVVVMLTDVFLLDLFNSVRLPTSTTVSIVFVGTSSTATPNSLACLTTSGLG